MDRIYTARAVTNGAHGEVPGVQVEVLEYVGRAGWAIRGTAAQSGPVDWPRWNAARADAVLADLGWVRVREWSSGGGLHFAEVVLAQRDAAWTDGEVRMSLPSDAGIRGQSRPTLTPES